MGEIGIFLLTEPMGFIPRLQEILLERFGLSEDVSDVVSFLLSDEERYINGQKTIAGASQHLWRCES